MDADFADYVQERSRESDARRDRALAIKACLDSLRTDARAFALSDLDRFLELAAMAAEEAAAELESTRPAMQLRYARPLGAC